MGLAMAFPPIKTYRPDIEAPSLEVWPNVKTPDSPSKGPPSNKPTTPLGCSSLNHFKIQAAADDVKERFTKDAPPVIREVPAPEPKMSDYQIYHGDMDNFDNCKSPATECWYKAELTD